MNKEQYYEIEKKNHAKQSCEKFIVSLLSQFIYFLHNCICFGMKN